jgi:hypothetical protein
MAFLLELPKFPQPAGLRLRSQIWKGLFFRPFSYHNKSTAVIFSSQSALCPFWGVLVLVMEANKKFLLQKELQAPEERAFTPRGSIWEKS